MKILVTGGSGFIGKNLVTRLRTEGNEVIIIDEKIDQAITTMPFSKIDIAVNKKSLKFAFEYFKPEIVIHLAAKTGVRESLLSSGDYTENNVTGFENLLKLVTQFKVSHTLYASSSSVYGLTDGTPSAENDTTDSPTSVYAATKKMNEIQAQTYHNLYGTQITGLRFFTVYGPHGRSEMAVHKFAKAILTKKPIQLNGGGSLKRSFTYVDDIVESIVRLIPKPCNHSIFNIGYGHTESLSNLIAVLEHCIGKVAITVPGEIPKGDVPITLANCSKLYEHTGFLPTISLQEGIPKFVDWFLKQK